MHTREQVLEMLQSELQIPDLSTDVEFRELPLWSSLTALLLLSRIREEFEVVIHSSDLSGLVTIQDIIDFIVK